MKGHFGVDSRSKLIHAVVATPANVADSKVLPDVARERNPRVGRPGLSRPAGGDPPARTARAGLRQPPLSPSRCRGRERAREKPDQIEGARQSRASDRYHQAGLRLCQSALPRAQKERSSPHCHLGAGQSVYRTPASIALRGGVIYLAWPPAVANVERRHTNNGAANPKLSLLLQFQWPVSAPSSL